MGEIINDYTDTLDRRLRNGEESDTLKTGIEELDAITGGMNAEDLVIIAARPGMGKTELALKIAEGVASRVIPGSGVRRGVLIFSMEMSAIQVVERGIAGAGMMSVSVLRNPSRMDDEGWARVASGMKLLADLDVWVVDASRLSVEEIRSISERHKQEHPNLSLIMADYLGLIEKPKAERNDLAIAHISGSLKAMAKDLKTPVISLSQLSRDVEKRPNKRPTNADLRDSGSIEQDADSIIMLYRVADKYIGSLEGLSSLEGQGQALNNYYNSQQYQDLAGQARYQNLAAAEATGGLGSTATSNQLAAIAPTLGQQWLSGQMNNYQNLANIGLGALQGQANAGQTYANNMSQISQQSAALAAANANRPSAMQSAIGGGASGAIAGAGLAKLIGSSTPWGAAIGGGLGLLGSLF